MQNLLEDLKELLQQNQRFMLDGNLFKNKIVECALNVDSDLIALLLKNENIKRHFFTQVGEALVFDKIKFQRFVSNKEFLPDSFTTFKSDIGLTVNDAFLKANSEVTLSFPYKDCVLEGGQSREEDRRNEIFFNVTLAPNEIDMLLKPKVFTNAKRYTTEGLQPFTKFCRNKQGAITDNLIIKGNNLLALHSIKREFAGRVKLIYIDPPYYFDKTKPSDAFCYNSNFKLSAWLTFMKNRLEISKDLLSNNGTILVHISEDGFAYLKILMIEIFGTDNFVETFIWKNTDNPDSLSSKSRASVEYIIAFERRIDRTKKYIGKDTENGDVPLLNAGNKPHKLIFPAGAIHFNIPDGKIIAGKPDRVEILNDFEIENGLNKQAVSLNGEFKWVQSTLNEELSLGTYFIVKTDKFSVRFQRKEATSMAPEKFIDEIYLSKAIGVGTNEDSNTHLKKMGINFTKAKPESVVAFFIRAITETRDIVLDFFAGSGTTQAVAHKMNRQYIGIEQMDYIETETIRRLQQVIEGEQGGISKSVNWRGGGEFVYMELKKYNQEFIDRIMAAETSANLLDIWQNMKAHSFIAYNADIEKYESKISEFESFPLAQQKEFMLAILDANQLYVNLSSLEDKDFACTEEEINLNKDFYGK